ncbi:hypothetical protein E1295_25415 [Nonomuraea mesophila]|uniref:Uncharacterized protein n=1 Tax=Nonomuraea mesophila TaxID=2530382 RepID=A0A4R5F884_9ACTN|nr:hypothetical protein [Nonomuraea mesophila]TDE44217.1 hypothetical protein E1295_25415 [Nonomuraea mesophila]
MNFCLSDLVPPLRWSDASTITLLTGQPDLPDAWWRTLPMPRVLAAIGPESLGELLTEIALEHWPAAAVGDVLPALHVLDPDEADEPAVVIALDRAGSWAGLLALTSRELVDQPFIQARPVLNTLFSAPLVRLARSRQDHPASAPASEAASAAEAAATVGPVLASAPAVPETAHGSEPVTADPPPAPPAEEHPAEAEQPDAQHSVTGGQPGAQQQAVEEGERRGSAAEQAMPHAPGERAADAVAQFAAEASEAAHVGDRGAAGSEVAAGPEPPAADARPDAEAVSAEQVSGPGAEAVNPEPAPQPAEAVNPEPAPQPAEAVNPEPAPQPAGAISAEPAAQPAEALNPEPAQQPAEAVSPEPVAEPAAEPVAVHGMGEGAEQQVEPRPESPLFEQPEQPQFEQAQPEQVQGEQAGQAWQPFAARAEGAPDVLAPGQDVLEASAEPAAGPEPEPRADAVPEPEPQPQAAPELEPQAHAAPQPEPQAQAAPEPEPQAHAAPEPAPEAHAVAEAGVPGSGAAVGGHGPALPELIEAAFAGLDDKSWAVAQNRIFTDEPSAVDQLAKLFAVPPAEIDATEDELRARLGQWLASDEAAPYRAHLDDLVRTLGPAAPKEQLIGAADWHQVEIRALEVPAWQFVLATLAPQPQPQPVQAQAQPSQPSQPSQSAFGPVEGASSTTGPPAGPPQFQAFAPVPSAGESNGDGAVDESGQPYEPLKDVSQTRRCFRQPDGRWWLRIDVTAEQLAGGECTLPTGFASYLNLSPGESRTVRSAAGELTMTWHGRPVLESIERLLVDVGAREGGHLFLTLSDEGVLRARHLPVAAQGAEKITKALRLVGYTAPGGTRDQAARVIATRIGMTGPVSLPDLLARLRERGDRDLLALLD